jgi:gas vesicle protein
MAENEGSPKQVSSRGAFLIGLVLGLGVGAIYGLFQSQRLGDENRKLRADSLDLTKQLSRAKGDLAAMKISPKVEK